MDFICSLTGKSPSTTGAGSEGALTKGPFNALAPTADLNNALVSMLLTGYGGFSSAAGYIGPRVPRRPRHQPADPRDLVPALPPRARPQAADRGGPPREARGLRVRRQARCSPAGWATASPASSCTPSSAGCSTTRRRSSPTRSCGPRRRTWRSSPTACTTSSRPSSGWPRRTSRTAPSRTPARRCGRCSTSWPTGSAKGKTPTTRRSARSSPASRCSASDWYQERLAVKQQRDIALWERHVAHARPSSWRCPATATKPCGSASARGSSTPRPSSSG